MSGYTNLFYFPTIDRFLLRKNCPIGRYANSEDLEWRLGSHILGFIHMPEKYNDVLNFLGRHLDEIPDMVMSVPVEFKVTYHGQKSFYHDFKFDHVNAWRLR